MEKKAVSWNKYKKSKFNSALAPEERNGQLRGTNLSNGPSPSFSSQWLTKRGYNIHPSSLGGIQIRNPNPVVFEPNEPREPLPIGFYYSANTRKNFLAKIKNDPSPNKFKNRWASYRVSSIELPEYVPKPTNGAPIPKRNKTKRRKQSRKRK
jgi:hypothetical protein